MKKIYKLLFVLGMIILMDSGLITEVSADTSVRSVELTEEERYDPKYYQPVERKIRSDLRGADISIDALEETVVLALQNFETQIDVSAFQIGADDINVYYFQILNNHPELFYVASSYSYSYNGKTVLAIMPSYTMEESEAKLILEEMDRAAGEAVALVSADMEDYEKALVIHDWLAVYCAYDYESYLNGSVPKVSHTAQGALVNKLAACDGYAKAYQYIMQSKLGIPCYLTSSDTMKHAWNIIRIGGKYYHVDVTWDDPTWDVIGRVSHNNFLLSDDGIMEMEHTGWVSDFEANDTTYENALWKNSSGSVISHNGYWYYVDHNASALCKTQNILTGDTVNLYSFEKWRIAGNRYYSTPFSYLQVYRNKLIFNGAKQIYAMPFDTEQVTELFVPTELPADTSEAVYSIYGFKLDGAMMYYSIQSSANLTEAQTAYIKSNDMPGVALRGTVNISGELRYGITLTANVTLAEGITGEVSYAWYRNGEKIADAANQTYTLTKQDVGKTISVVVIQEDCIGELTAQTELIQKAVPVKPVGPLSLNGYYGKALSSVTLPEGYAWKNPDTIMSKIGTEVYPVTYCPDHDCYEMITDLEASVSVSCETHVWDEGRITKAPTTSEKGVMTYTCTVCQAVRTEEIDVLTPPADTEEPESEKPVDTEEPESEKPVDTEEPESEKPADTEEPESEKPVDTEEPESEKPVQPPKKGTVLKSGKMSYKVLKAGSKNGTVAVVKTASSSKTLTIPATVKLKGITYKVTSIGANAFAKNKKITKVIIGANVSTIDKGAFSGCKNLKAITIQSTKLKTIGKDAIKNIYKKAKVQCPKTKYKYYKKLFTSKTGYQKKTMKLVK